MAATAIQNNESINPTDDGNVFALAITVLRAFAKRLPKADQEDVCMLLPLLLWGDDEERASAHKAMLEIFDQPSDKIRPMEFPKGVDPSLRNWVDFVGDRIREARTEAGITQEELAQKSGIRQSHISRLENKQHSPNAKTLKKIAQALNLPSDYFDPSV